MSGIFGGLILKPTSQIPTAGLLAEWKFNNNHLDTSGNGHNGTPTGTTFGPNRHGAANSALVLNGTSDFVDVGSGLPIGTNVRSFSFWIKSSSANVQSVIGNRNGNVNGYAIQLHPTVLSQFVNNVPSAGLFYPSGNILNNSWHHVVEIRAGTANNKIYVDNSSKALIVNTENLTDAADSLNTRIGVQKITVDDRFFNGSLDDMRIYDRVLTVDEIDQLFNE